MDGMKERADAFEQKYMIDEELRFKANALSNRMIGLWAADRLGKTGEAANEYAKEVVNASFQRSNEEAVVQKIVHDFHASNVEIDESKLRNKMAQLLREAIERVKNS
ncbi:DUF1476 domain-containing protein [Bartonella apis]|uniref:DUF1476 domain-containing protein n=1 Tax=Bartonella apis TaxID=1686310 RepID=A0A1R0F717_9HYPH|nr:DUF1476 domain-containing protein [Bartonella apis]OLY42755.1 hypothetical protein PEB0149_001620 [Bartonella apis]OLY45641.1 hypothetical protein PEB0150_014520 [Bartonella apis]OLY47233.1 hypothetical protein PEB0122_020740 [Bartonella apis]